MRISKILVMMLTLPVMFLAACSAGEDSPVAEVNDRKISMKDYERAWATVDPQFLPATTDLGGRKEFLDIMLNKEVMAIKADELGYDKDTYVVQGMEAFKKVGLQAAYFKYNVADRINVTDADVQEYYKMWGKRLSVKQILCDTEVDANEVYDALKEGHDFETLCREHSKGPDAAEGGRAISANFGNFPPDWNELFQLKVGEVAKPIRADYGYFIVKIMSSTPPTREPLENVEEVIREHIRLHQEIAYSAESAQAVRDKHGLTLYEDNLVTAFHLLPPDRPLTNPPDRRQEVYPLLDIPPGELDKPLMTYDDEVITMKDFSDIYDRSSFFERPRRQLRIGGVAKFLVHLVMSDLVVVELEESGLENEPEVARILNRKREQLMVDKLYQDLVVGQTEVNFQQVDRYYNDNLEQFRRGEERRFGVVMTGDREEARRVVQKIKDGNDFSEIVVEHSLHTTTKENDGDTGF
ncbi:MAG: peptidyl-prolyl cis-trans isomerase, partial [bacterium]|nr:peptidyl-prolyl cis-trans isomerase [bacterium]